MSFIMIRNLEKEYKVNKKSFKALNDINLDIEKNEFVMILGPSGSGKSTLLNIIGGMDTKTNGSVIINGEEITNYTDNELRKFRKEKIGFVFQSYNLIENLNVLENVMLTENYKVDDALKTLEILGIKDRAYSFPSMLSGGERQRVSIARAILKKPQILLCDEPTGALDSKNGLEVMKILKDMNDNGQTIIMVTHNTEYVKYASKVIRLRDGSLDYEGDKD